MRVRKIRLFRLIYGISCRELGAACGLSAQRVSEIELRGRFISDATVRKLTGGLEAVIRQKQAKQEELKGAFERHRETLFEPVMETEYEL